MLRNKPLSEVPERKWSLSDLKAWLQSACKRWALDAYYMGLALIYARDHLKEEGKWMEFCREACPGYSYETISRYIRLAEAVKDPDALQGIRLNQAYELTGVVSRKATNPQNTPHATQDNPGVPNERNQDTPGDQLFETEVQQREPSRPGTTLTFFVAKTLEQLAALEQVPKKERWQELDVETVRASLIELLSLVERALKDLPKLRRKAS